MKSSVYCAVLFSLLLLAPVNMIGAEKHKKFSLGIAIPIRSFFFYTDVPGTSPEYRGSISLTGELISFVDVWGCYYLKNGDFFKLNFSANTDVVPGADPVWVFVPDYTGSIFGTAMMYSSLKYMKALPLGFNCGIGLGLGRNELHRDDWTKGAVARSDLSSFDILAPVEINWGILYASYVPTAVQIRNTTVSYRYRHLISIEFGGNFKF